ncbi:MAG TPA: PEGA domain-containing protein [Polyangiaceae bacterium]|nr:PEGA domain-containing protein [Polyangiaceae bacterium]HOD24973.1 PEGA domain-containing protein [Polyangiaceae bacterium]HOE50637.1 PEGA domain-containing protein [Polyangiaceae bacterium]HOH03292.1 PEGA domain-containing protein [Polyangiaceae bacterium]HOT10533.1 PEGA domain-containing protein [Polyangiaceae bacterium]
MRDRNQLAPGGRVLAAVLCGLLATSAMAPYAFAQPKGSAPAAAAEKQKRDAARAHYEAGKAKLDAKDFAGALTEFQAANNLIPSPQAQEKIALCYDGMNDVSHAIQAYQTFVDQAKDNEKLKTEVDNAKNRIEALKNAPVAVAIVTEPASAQVQVDGQPQMGATPLDLNLTPGTHKVRVSADGFEPAEKDVEVTVGGAKFTVSFTLNPVAGPVAEPTPPPPATSTAATVSTSGNKSNLPAYITLGVAGASAIVGTIFGIKALSNKSDFNDTPTTELADDAERNALISDMTFGVAITLGVTGTVLLLSNDSSGQEQAAKDARSQKTMRLTPFVGPSGGGAAATWRF